MLPCGVSRRLGKRRSGLRSGHGCVQLLLGSFLQGTPPSSFLVIIARDVDEAELEPIAPVGLFQFSSWNKPADALARDDRRAIKAEWVV